jgi:hypothetical protein
VLLQEARVEVEGIRPEMNTATGQLQWSAEGRMSLARMDVPHLLSTFLLLN